MANEMVDISECKLSDLRETGSTEVFDYFCGVCSSENQIEAVGYCSSCEIYLCTTCSEHHRKLPVLRNHVILDRTEFRQLKTRRSLYERMLIPRATTRCPREKLNYGHDDYRLFKKKDFDDVVVRQILCIPGTDKFALLLYQREAYDEGKSPCVFYQIGTTDMKNGYKHAGCAFTTDSIEHKVMSCNENTCNTKEHVYLCKSGRQPNVIEFCHKQSTYRCVFKLPFGGKVLDVSPFNKGLALLVNLKTKFNFPAWKIQHLSLEGEIIKEFIYDCSGEELLLRSRCLVSNHAQDILYVSDVGDNSVKALDTNGTILLHYTHPTIQQPLGIATDEENNIYVVCSEKLIQINQHRNESRVLLNYDSSSEVIFVCYNNMSQTLLLIDKAGEITTFKFLP